VDEAEEMLKARARATARAGRLRQPRLLKQKEEARKNRADKHPRKAKAKQK